MPPALEAAGYTVVNPGLFTQGTEDFSSVINKFKAEGCECLVGTWNPPDFANFWKQCVQQGFSPKATAIARAILTRPDMDAVGDIANGLCLEVWWEKTWPFTSPLTGLTCQGIVDAWDTANPGKPYTPALGLTGGGGFDVVTDVVKRTANLDDPASYVEAIKATDLQTILGPIKFDAPFANCALTPLVGGQWIGKVGAWERLCRGQLALSGHPEDRRDRGQDHALQQLGSLSPDEQPIAKSRPVTVILEAKQPHEVVRRRESGRRPERLPRRGGGARGRRSQRRRQDHHAQPADRHRRIPTRAR